MNFFIIIMKIKNVLNEEQLEIVRVPVNLSKFQIPRGEVHIISERCKECSYCWTYCPSEVLEKSDSLNSNGYYPTRVREGKEDSCVACGMCESVCPDFAIYVEERKQ